MKNVRLYLTIALIAIIPLMSGCNEEKLPDITCPDTPCIDEPYSYERLPLWIVDMIVEDGIRPFVIYEGTYHNETAYYIPWPFPDWFNDLYNQTGELLCSPDGGYTGKGDGKCPDFSRDNFEVVWENNYLGLGATMISKLVNRSFEQSCLCPKRILDVRLTGLDNQYFGYYVEFENSNIVPELYDMYGNFLCLPEKDDYCPEFEITTEIQWER